MMIPSFAVIFKTNSKQKENTKVNLKKTTKKQMNNKQTKTPTNKSKLYSG